MVATVRIDDGLSQRSQKLEIAPSPSDFGERSCIGLCPSALNLQWNQW